MAIISGPALPHQTAASIIRPDFNLPDSTVSHDRTFFDTFLLILGILVLMTVGIYVLAGTIADKTQGEAIRNEPMAIEKMDARIAPVSRVAIAGEVAPDTGGEAEAPVQTAASIYEQACVACHGLGVAGAPKMGDVDAWAPRIAKGLDMLSSNAIAGYVGEAGVMPAKGGRTDLSDEIIAETVAYMVESSQ